MAEGDGSALGAQTPGRGLSTTNANADGNGGWRGLYDQAMKESSYLQTLHHDGGMPDDAARQRYRQLQGNLAGALADGQTPDEARLPLDQAAYGLFAGGNAAGLAGPGQVPPGAFRTMFDAMPFSGGGIAPSGPRAWRPSGDLPGGAGTRTAVAVPESQRGEPSVAARPPQFPGAHQPIEPDGVEQRGLAPPGEGEVDPPGSPKTTGSEKDKLWRPSTRAELDSDLLAKGFSKANDKPSPNGYVVYKHADGRQVTVKPSGEVIPVKPTLSSKGKPYRERTNYEFIRLPDQSHSTGHFVEPIDENDSENE